jgi:hypothetical protein
MGGGAIAQGGFTLLFAALGLLSLVWLVSDRHRPLLVVGNLLHLGMAVSMAAMVWVAPSAAAVVVQLVVFGTGALWFAMLAGLRATGRVRRRAVGEHGVWQLIGHAVMMTAMVWMVAVMGMSGAGTSGHEHVGLSTWPALFGVAATAGLVVTAVLLVVAGVDCVRSSGVWRRHSGDLAGGAAMSLGMAAMCWAMLG